MKNAPLRFDGMSLHHNPHKLHIENRHHIRSLSTPTAACDSLYLNRKPCVISGEGELYGVDCLMQYQALYRLYRSRKRAKLALPQLPTMYAYLRELQLLAEPEENVLTYRFVFAEAQSPRLHEPSAEYYFAEEGLCPARIAELFEALLPHFELKGTYQRKNLHTILQAAEILQIPQEAIQKGLENVCESTGLMGRWQTLQKQPLVICDTGHNVGGWEYLSRQIAEQSCRQLRIVFGMVDDKDINTVMEMLPRNAVYYWTQATTKRAIPAEKVAVYGEQHHLKGTIYNNVESAYKQALKDADKDDFVFVGGSSYIVSDLLEKLNF